MLSDTSAATKQCCSCGADITHQPRLKDSQGRYWCVPCDRADKRSKHLAESQAVCAGCHKTFPKAKLTKDGDHYLCKECLTNAAAEETARHKTGPVVDEAPPSDRRRILMLAAVLVVLVLFSIFYNFFMVE